MWKYSKSIEHEVITTDSVLPCQMQTWSCCRKSSFPGSTSRSNCNRLEIQVSILLHSNSASLHLWGLDFSPFAQWYIIQVAFVLCSWLLPKCCIFPRRLWIGQGSSYMLLFWRSKSKLCVCACNRWPVLQIKLKQEHKGNEAREYEPPKGDQTHLGHHKPTHLGHHRQETNLEHHISTHLGHHRPHFCERVVTGGHSVRSPTQTYYIPLGLDMGTWGSGTGTWGLGDMAPLDHLSTRPTHL